MQQSSILDIRNAFKQICYQHDAAVCSVPDIGFEQHIYVPRCQIYVASCISRLLTVCMSHNHDLVIGICSIRA